MSTTEERIKKAVETGYSHKLVVGARVKWIYRTEPNIFTIVSVGEIYKDPGIYNFGREGYSFKLTDGKREENVHWWALRPFNCSKSKEL